MPIQPISDWQAHIAAGRQYLQLLADRGNQAALDFYRKMGWQTTGLIGLRYWPPSP